MPLFIQFLLLICRDACLDIDLITSWNNSFEFDYLNFKVVEETFYSKMAASEVSLLQFRPAYDVLAYCALSGAPLARVSIENIQNPTILACPQLPCLRIRHETFVPRNFIIEYLKKNYSNLDAGLSSKVNADIRSLTALIAVELELALEVARYDDDEHWKKVTYPMLIKALPWPFNRLVARKLRHDIVKTFDRIPATKGHRLNDWAIPTARTAYKALNDLLATGNWLLGTTTPTSVDALLFGHVAQAKFQPGLSDLLKDFMNIEAHYERVLLRVASSKFFSYGACAFAGPDLSLTLTATIPTAVARVVKPNDEPTTPSTQAAETRFRTEGAWQAVTFGVLAVLAYINWSWAGLIQIREVEDVDQVILEDTE